MSGDIEGRVRRLERRALAVRRALDGLADDLAIIAAAVQTASRVVGGHEPVVGEDTVEVSCCANPVPKRLTVTFPLGSFDIAWNGASWIGAGDYDLTVYSTSDCVTPVGTAPVRFYGLLGCGSGSWTFQLYSRHRCSDIGTPRPKSTEGLYNYGLPLAVVSRQCSPFLHQYKITQNQAAWGVAINDPVTIS